MTSKIALGTTLTITGVMGLLYAAIDEISGYSPRNLLFGIILLGIIFFFFGMSLLRDVWDRIS